MWHEFVRGISDRTGEGGKFFQVNLPAGKEESKNQRRQISRERRRFSAGRRRRLRRQAADDQRDHEADAAQPMDGARTHRGVARLLPARGSHGHFQTQRRKAERHGHRCANQECKHTCFHIFIMQTARHHAGRPHPEDSSTCAEKRMSRADLTTKTQRHKVFLTWCSWCLGGSILGNGHPRFRHRDHRAAAR